MQKLIFATNNIYKLQEIKDLLSGLYEVLSLEDIEVREDIPETADSLEGNALQKARFVHLKTGADCFADDTGLEVEALNGKPGVYSARYAGEGASFEDNMDKLLSDLDGKSNRQACFRTVIALIYNGNEYLFEGIVKGKILHEKTGSGGFGYDPLFIPEGFEKSFAEMSPSEKNAISHRGLSVNKLVDFLAGGRPGI